MVSRSNYALKVPPSPYFDSAYLVAVPYLAARSTLGYLRYGNLGSLARET